MARNVQRRNEGPPAAQDPKDAPPMAGGAPGAPEELLNKVETHIALPGHNIVGDARRRSGGGEDKPPAAWRVVNVRGKAEDWLIIDHSKVFMKSGKTVTEATYDLDLLHRQGVALRCDETGEMYAPRPKAPPAPPPAESEEPQPAAEA